mmetsp:Transcript_12868/g.20634  ORF Transcript_12868/g.20634 Transcript_12868/m.20634 type:complete len:288 (-) Transcript_12868:152-1015(-)
MKVLVYIPGIGCRNPERLINVYENVRTLKATAKYTEMHCVIGSYLKRKDFHKYNNETYFRMLEDLEKECRVFYTPGAHYSDFTRFMHPYLLEVAGFDYILSVQDDVIVGREFNVDREFRFATKYGLDVFSPNIILAHHFPTLIGDNNQIENKTLIVYTDFIEIFITAFTPRAWECYYHCSDHNQLSKGWGMDMGIYKFCKDVRGHSDFKMGVFKNVTSSHGILGDKGVLAKYPSWRNESAVVQLRRFEKQNNQPDGQEIPMTSPFSDHYLAFIDKKGIYRKSLKDYE